MIAVATEDTPHDARLMIMIYCIRDAREFLLTDTAHMLLIFEYLSIFKECDAVSSSQVQVPLLFCFG